MINSTKTRKLKTAIPTKISTFAMILLLATSLILAFAQPALAQIGVSQPEKTVGFMSVAPTLIGVGQTATVNLWVFPLPTNYLYQPYFGGFNEITVTFVKPDGSEDSFMPVDGTGQFVPGQTEATGSLYFFYEPDMAGDWSVSFTMPEQNVTDSTGTVIYKGCTSSTASFTVQTDPVNAGLLNGWPWPPLPNENVFWSYPINTNNREWSQISGDWLAMMNSATFYGPAYRHWQQYGSAPSTAHILWSHSYNQGGIIGGDYGSLSDMTSTSTDKGSVVLNGKVYYNIYGAGQFQCVHQATGEILYTMDGSVTGAIHLPGNELAQNMLDPSVVLAGSFGSNVASYIFESTYTTWNYRNPRTGTIVRSLANATSSYYVRLIDGTNLAYGVRNGNLFKWDLSKVTGNNWPTGIIWETPLPTPIAIARGVNLFGVSADLSTVVVNTYNEYWGYSTEDGTSTWYLSLDYPVNTNEEFDLYGVDDFIIYDPTETTFKCYSMLNGRLLWTSRSYADSPWASTWTVYNSQSNDYENLYLALPDGTVTALSLETGEEIWRSEPIPSTEYTNNVNPFVYGCMLVGGKVYAFGGYALGYGINPIPRFALLVCINATTGDIEYTLPGGVYPSSAANGYVTGAGYYDGNMYCIGKGPTQTTIMASPKVSAQGTSVLIEGSIIDISPIAQDIASQFRFPNGVPAVADEDMSEWMDYLYMQNATLLNNPPLPDGVTVTLSVVDPNSNCYEIGTVTSDSSGLYKLTWTPEIEGEYTVYAQFDGSGSYYSSYATTALSVSEAVATVTPEPQQAAPDYMPMMYAILAVGIIAIIIGLIAIFKKR